MIKTKKIIEVYSDGSGNSLDSDGGWGYVIIVDGIKVKEGSGFLRSATNNTAELTAAMNGLNEAIKYMNFNKWDWKDHSHYMITLISDSQLVLNYAKNTWRCKAPHLMALNNTIQSLYNKLNCSTKWVKGHSGDEHNERCDVLAGTARKEGRKKNSAHLFISTLIKLNIVNDPLFLMQVSALF